MIKFVVSYFLTVILISCSTHRQNKKQNDHENRGPNFTQVFDSSYHKNKNIDQALLNKIQGIWAENHEENAYFMIKENSIIYMENLLNPFKFTIKKDTLIYKYSDGFFKITILKAVDDSLIINSDGVIMRLYNRQKSSVVVKLHSPQV